jgi:xanthine dehydrogenase small subunit
MTTTPEVMVNGEARSVADIKPYVTALDWLRDQGLTGAKEGCAEGECGACSIMVARPDGEGRTLWTALNACLVPVLSLDGQEVVTAEGLGKPGGLHPVQEEMAHRGGSQCGYCTPGFICSMAAEYYRPDRTPADPSSNGKHAADPEHGPNGFDLHALSGNLCRCTGYRPIRDAAYALDVPPEDDTFAQRCATPAPAAPATRVRVGDTEFARPVDLAAAVALLAERPDATVIAGCTDWGVEVNLRGTRAPFVVAVDRLPELRTFSVGPSEVELGAALTLSEAERLLEGRIPLLDQLWPQFASRLIRNGATLGGNLGTASPIGDAPPALLALEAKLVLSGPDGDREVALADYFTGYRQTVKQKGELIRAVRIPMPPAPMAAFHKIAKRRFDDISSVAIAFAFDVVDGVVQRATIGLGGVAATPLRASATEDALRGRPWTADTVREAAVLLGHEGTPIDDHRASAAFRAAMLEQSLLKFHAESAVPEGATS